MATENANPTTSDDVELTDNYATCRKCSEPIADDADRCKHCGYEGYTDTPADGYARMTLVGSFLTFLIVTSPIGLPMFAIGLLGWTYCKLFRRGYWQPQER